MSDPLDPPPELPGHRAWIVRGLVLLGLAAVVFVARLTLFSPKPVPVAVARVARGLVEETVTNSRSGTVASRRQADLSPEIGGRVASLPAREGRAVRAGEILMAIANEEYAGAVALEERSRRAALAAEREARKTAELAALELSRIERLAAEAVVSAELLDQARSRRDVTAAGLEAATARVEQAAAALALARTRLSKTILRAPFDGVVAEVSTEVGEWITPSPPGLPIPPVVRLLDGSPSALYVSAPMDEVDVARVAVGQAVRLTLDAFPGRPARGRVVRVAPYVSAVKEQSRTFEIEVTLDDAAFAALLKPGTSVDVEVVLGSKAGVLRVPSHALLEGNRVLVVENGRLASRPVETGLRNWTYTEVVRGLSEGDAVVVSLDRVEVKDGAKVRVESETGG